MKVKPAGYCAQFKEYAPIVSEPDVEARLDQNEWQ
jgi:hypothetical protein